MLRDLDVLVIDLQDVGTRVYTYLHDGELHGARRAGGLPVVVCDLPNLIGGDAVEGARLQPACASFVGQYRSRCGTA